MKTKSFTLIEVLVALVILGILSTFIIISLSSVIDSSNDAKRKKDLDSVSKMLMTYGVLNGSYPTGSGNLETVLSSLVPDYTSSFPKDPSGSSYTYISDEYGSTYTITATLSTGQALSYNPEDGFSQGEGGGPWYDNSWLNRKEITLSNSGSELTDYQIRLTVDYESNMQSDFKDLRFTSSDKETELSYWIESINPSISAAVWVKVSSVPNGDSKIYMYYGNNNPLLVSASSGNNTFIFFKDIENVNIGAIGDWVLEKAGNFNTTQTVYAYQDNTKTVRVYAEQNGSWAGWYYTWARWDTSISSGDYVLDGQYKSCYTNASYWRTSIQVNGVEKNGGGAPNTSWNNFSYNLLSQNITSLRFGNYDYMHTAGHEILYDNIRIRKYTSSVPSVNIGLEE